MPVPAGRERAGEAWRPLLQKPVAGSESRGMHPHPSPTPHRWLGPALNQDSAETSVLQGSEGQVIFHGGSLEGFLEEGTTWKQQTRW